MTLAQIQLPPSGWSIELTKDDIERFDFVKQVSRRLETAGEVVWLSIRDGERTWCAKERNTTVWGNAVLDGSPFDLLMPFAPVFLRHVAGLVIESNMCTLKVSPDQKVCIVSSGAEEVHGDIPVEWKPSDLEFGNDGDISINLNSMQARRLGELINDWPGPVDKDEYPNFLAPFVVIEVGDEKMTCTMDWSRYGGRANTLVFAINATPHLKFECDSYVLGHGLTENFSHEDWTMTLSSTNPTHLGVHNSEIGFTVTLERECVALVREQIENELKLLDLEVKEWNTESSHPIVHITYESTQMEIVIIPDKIGHDDYIRVTMCVASGVSNNLATLQEVNNFNEARLGQKYVMNGDSIFLVTDIATTAISELFLAIITMASQWADLSVLFAALKD